jgi:hypothetical protein|tara:strand:+ start:1858 stop:2211 length:354 start_codon:yes stop_codon:yes gene_type:complete
MSRGRPAQGELVAKRKYILEFEDSTWYFDLDKYKHGPYLVEHYSPGHDKLEKLYSKLQQLEQPEYQENGRKKRITKNRVKEIEASKAIYWKEHYRLFPEDRPKVPQLHKKKRGRRNS